MVDNMPYKDSQKRREHYRMKYKEDKEFKTKRNIAFQKRKKIQKLKAIEYLGGKCNRHGYNVYPQILVFHHIKEKEFDIGNRLKLSWGKMQKELDKCELLCPNCHALAHTNQTNGRPPPWQSSRTMLEEAAGSSPVWSIKKEF